MLTKESKYLSPLVMRLCQRGLVMRERIADRQAADFIYMLRAKEKPELNALHCELNEFQRGREGRQA